LLLYSQLPALVTVPHKSFTNVLSATATAADLVKKYENSAKTKGKNVAMVNFIF
jgi:hypothetical protein